jgi:hypothetical protein
LQVLLLVFLDVFEEVGLRAESTVLEVVIHLDALPPDILVLLAGAPHILGQRLALIPDCSHCLPRDEVLVGEGLKLLEKERFYLAVSECQQGSEVRLHQRSHLVHYLVADAPHFLRSDRLAQLDKRTAAALADDGEDHPPDEADGEEGKKLAELTLLYLSEYSWAQGDVGLVFPQAKTQEVV